MRPGPVGGWFDSHCHIQDEEDRASILDRARAAGVGRVVCVGTDARSSNRALALAGECEGVWATVGLHPHDAGQGWEPVRELITAHAGTPDMVAIGECGLDYHYDHSPRARQRQVFAEQVALAGALAAALVIHTREAWADTFDILREVGTPRRTVFHCFTGGPPEAERALGLGAYLSFSGIVTFKGAAEVRAAAALCPLDRLLVETDSPYLAPAPHRGSRNEPAFLPAVGAGVAAAKGVSPEELMNASSASAGEVFCL